ncbi:CocE/NonD family hydrolase [Chryseobacterium sp. JUb7]|uniref:CocE/NonD family hydrolase n=1 Tax=Chryseobacterium sp. JUb7 TaxID=2940599 RepID=UPI00216A80D0|nr:CocE/NonD family hydrolase [Chryseobacterium sp. JUb7]MCS3530801.1 putative CocE/NonD family hydrolase [Chryseobacterium sp. JUb7]
MNKISDYTVSNPESLIKYLAKELKVQYKEKDKATYYDNIFRISMLNEDYNLSLIQLDSLKSFAKSNPTLADVVGVQFEIYNKTLKRTKATTEFEKIYKEEFIKKYDQLSIGSRAFLPQFFATNVSSLEKEITEFIKKHLEKNDIDVADALQLCRKYNTYNVAKKSIGIAIPLIKKLDKEAFVIHDSIKIYTKDKAVLSLSVVLNNVKGVKPDNTILLNTIYSGKENIGIAKELASHGYAVVILNTRGKYLSTDSIEPFEHEVNDISEAINWIIKQSWSNGNVGMIGGSYLGFSQWAATKKLHPALKTIVPQASVGIGTMDYPMTNNVFMSYALRWLNNVTNNRMTDFDSFNNTDHWNSVYKKWYESGKSFRKLDSISGKTNVIFQKWLAHPGYDDFWKGMVPYKKEYAKINIPVLTTTGYYDPDKPGALYYFKEHNKYYKNADHYLIIGPYDHAGAEGNIRNEFKNYTIDPVAKVDLNKIWMEWFDYIFKGKQKPAFLKDKINYQVMGANQWKSTSSIETFEENKTKLYLDNNGKELILSDVKSNGKDFSALKINFSDRTDADEIINQKNNIIDTLVYKKNSLIFSTKTFDKTVEFSGNFTGDLKVLTNKKDVDLYINLYELMPDGKYFQLIKYVTRASYAKNNEKRNLLTPGKKEIIPIINNDFVSKKIEKGSKLVLIVGVLKSPLWQINYGSGKDVSDETIDDAKEPLDIKFFNDSYIEIPVRQ